MRIRIRDNNRVHRRVMYGHGGAFPGLMRSQPFLSGDPDRLSPAELRAVGLGAHLGGEGIGEADRLL
jgi:hypothetical protein